MKSILCLVLGFVTISLVGCGPKTEETSVRVTGTAPKGAEGLKIFLEDLAAKGNPVGSGGMVMQQYVDEIKKTDPAKAEALQKGVDGMVSLTDPNKVKAKAKEMLGTLAK